MMTTEPAMHSRGMATPHDPIERKNIRRIDKNKSASLLDAVLSPNRYKEDAYASPQSQKPERTVRKLVSSKSAFFSPQVTTLFSEGMGVGAKDQPGAAAPKLTHQRLNSQRSYCRARDLQMQSGSFAFAYNTEKREEWDAFSPTRP